jgi:DNA uptake protein ComE-like DNA-binding protein
VSWKDFLYFRKGSRVGVLLLLILILLALLLNVLLSYRASSPVVVMQNDSIVREFDAFLQRLQPNESALTGEAMERSSRIVESRSATAVVSGSESSIGDHSGVTIEMGSRHDLSSREEVGQRQAVADEASQGNRYPRYPRVEKLSEGETISLNATDTAEWKRVPGIGTVYASRIVKYHERLGGFARKEQLLEVYGVDGELYARIAPYIEVSGSVRGLAVNQLEFRELLRHPYLSYKQVQAIVYLRHRKGRVDSIQELGMLDEFTSDDIYRLEPYLEF